MTLEALLEHLRAVAIEFRQSGQACCAQLAEQAGDSRFCRFYVGAYERCHCTNQPAIERNAA